MQACHSALLEGAEVPLEAASTIAPQVLLTIALQRCCPGSLPAGSAELVHRRDVRGRRCWGQRESAHRLRTHSTVSDWSLYIGPFRSFFKGSFSQRPCHGLKSIHLHWYFNPGCGGI